MSWKDKAKEWGGGDIAFLSEDNEAISFIVVGEPELLEGKFKGKPSEKVGCPVVTDDGFQLLIVGKRLFRKISKHEDIFKTSFFTATRHGESEDVNTRYELKVETDAPMLKKLQAIKAKDFKPEMIPEAVKAAIEVMMS